MEQEYFVSGLANVYTWPAPGPAVVRTANAPYTTRILVRKPAKVADFSGTVVVEPLNPSNLFDLNLGWGLMHDQLIRNGDIWVGVTIKPVAMQTLKTFDPERYAPLAMDNPLPLTDPANCATVPVGQLTDAPRTDWPGTSTRQLGELLRGTTKKNPIAYGHQQPRHDLQLYGFGYSQTGGYMYDYINAVEPLAMARNGRPTYDAYIVAVAGGAFAGIYPINQCEPVPAVDDPRRQFSNVGVPIIHVMSQSDYLRGITARRPDSDVPADAFRHYEMAGAGHATPGELNFAAAPADIEKGGRAVPPMDCNEGPRQPVPERRSSSTASCATSTSGCARGSSRRTVHRSSYRTARPSSTGGATWSAACARRTSTCRPRPGTAVPPGHRSARSPVTRCRSAQPCSGRSTPATLPT